MPTGLPPGLGINSSTGVIAGDPVTAGTFTFTVQITDANGLIARSAQEVIIYQVVVTGDAWYGVVGEPYSYTGYAATGGTGPYTWDISAGALPGGVTMAGATGYLSGTPTTEETATFTVRATDTIAGYGVLADTIQIDAEDGPWFVQRYFGGTQSNFVRSAVGTNWAAAATEVDPIYLCCNFKYSREDDITVGWSSTSPDRYVTSTDGGRTWTSRLSGLTGGSGGGRGFNGGDYWFVPMSSGYIARSADLVTWTNPTASAHSRGVSFIMMNGVLYNAGGTTIGDPTFHSSADNGVTWVDTGVAIDPFHGGNPGLATRWRTNGPNDHDGTYSILAIQTTLTRRLIYKIGLDLTDVTMVYEVPAPPSSSWEPECIGYDGVDGWVVVFQAGDIYYSTDGGDSWSASATVLSSGAISPGFHIYSDGQRFVIAHGGGVSYSTTGETWTTVVPSEGAVDYYGICFTL